MIPVHVRPVVSFDSLKKKELKDPTTGLDRFNLTDVGKALFTAFDERKADLVLKGVELPFPWEIVFKMNNEPQASLRGMKVGPSTYRSIFKLLFFDNEEVLSIIKRSLELVGRDVLRSPYWDDITWQAFQKQFRLSKDEVVTSNDRILGGI